MPNCLFNIWQHFEPTLAILYSYWPNIIDVNGQILNKYSNHLVKLLSTTLKNLDGPTVLLAKEDKVTISNSRA